MNPNCSDASRFSVNVHFRMSGYFRLITYSKREGRRVRAEFSNLILNQGLDRVAQGAWIDYCQVGTGNTAPANGQTGLAAHVAGSNSVGVADVQSFVSGGSPYHQLVRTRRFAAGVATGTLAEVGMGWGASGATLFSRALILDSGGTPTTISVLADETLDVEYTLRIYPPTGDVTGTKNISGVDYGYVLRAADIGGTPWNLPNLVAGAICSNTALSSALLYPSTSVLGANTSSPSGTGINVTSLTAATYTPGSYMRSKTFVWGLAVTPAGGAKCMSAQMGANFGASGCRLQMSFDSVVPKSGSNVLSLVMSVSWARV